MTASRPVAARTPVAYATSGHGPYAVLVAVFCCLLLISNVAATKGIAFGPIITDGGAFLFPLTYVVGDVLSEVYGLRTARRVILLGFAMAVLAALTFYLVQISPPADFYANQSAFESVLGFVPLIVLASVCGYLVGQFLNAYVLVRLKARTQERHLWARLVGSTVVGEFADTLVFCAIAASVIGITTTPDFLNYLIVGFVYKTVLEIVLLPVTYRVIALVKRREPSYAPRPILPG